MSKKSKHEQGGFTVKLFEKKKETTSTTNEESTDSSHPTDADPTPIPEPTRTTIADQSIRELAAAPAVQQPICITFPQGDTPFQLKTSLIHLLPTFHGLPSESPHKHLFFPVSKASEIRRSILGIKQKHEESLSKYWERYKKLCATRPTPSSLAPRVNLADEFMRAYGIYTMTDHPTDCCPTLQEETVNAVGNFPGPPQRPYNPHVLKLNRVTLMSQLAQTVGRLESSGKLPSQTETNHRENVSAITLRSGTIIEQQAQKENGAKKSIRVDEANTGSQEEGDATTQRRNSTPEPEQSPYAEPPPFPSRFIKKDKQAEEKEILDIFRKVEINIPLLEVIRKVPRYARFLKDLCTNKRKLFGHEKVNLGENVSAVLTRRLPPKLKDQGMFTIPCKIGKVNIKRAMCDLGASINVMPLSVYNTPSTDPLKETRVTIQLADRSIIYPEEVLENILVQVSELIFPVDFYVIDMENDRANTSPEILLGRPFLGTKNLKIEVRSGLLTLECNGEIVKFNVYKAMRHPKNVQSINFIGIFEPAIDEFIETGFVNDLCREIEDFEEEIRKFEKSFSVNFDLCFIPSKSKISFSVLQEPKIELKLPPEQLRKGCTLSEIISKLKKIQKSA
ncbi:hypothetical protein V6N11_013539 [Hibiscus sabdariffa]|uniref:Retrotransposon gag domain-containing protein n=1 Tax=Hibiscus sabdariffa TaxID=183260 RepID=A0ABR2NJW0_9ROSI